MKTLAVRHGDRAVYAWRIAVPQKIARIYFWDGALQVFMEGESEPMVVKLDESITFTLEEI